MSSCSLSYLSGVFNRVSTISCGSDVVMDPVTVWIITPLPHDIAQLLTSPHLNYNHYICRRRCRHFVVIVLVLIVIVVVISSLFVFNYFHSWKCGLVPSVFTRVLLCPLVMKGTNPLLLWQSL